MFSYKNQYKIKLLDIGSSCDDSSVADTAKIKLPKGSEFRQTLDKSAQTLKEMIVHIYEVDETIGLKQLIE